MLKKTPLCILACLAANIANGMMQDVAEVRVTMAEAMRAATHHPQPEYARLAKETRIQGDVLVQLKISDQGDVAQVSALSGNTLLSSPVVRTVRQWKFKPFQFEGKPTAVTTNLRFSFRI